MCANDKVTKMLGRNLFFTVHSHSFMQRPVHPSFGRVKTVVDGYKYGWMGKK